MQIYSTCSELNRKSGSATRLESSPVKTFFLLGCVLYFFFIQFIFHELFHALTNEQECFRELIHRLLTYGCRGWFVQNIAGCPPGAYP